MPFTRLTYFSESRIDCFGAIRQLADILSISNRKNQAANITGALIFDTRWFVQTLEGERELVWATFLRIQNDARHRRVTPVEITTVPGPYFGNWWMGYAEPNEETQETFAPYLLNGAFMPPLMAVNDILSLMVELAKFGYQRKIAA